MKNQALLNIRYFIILTSLIIFFDSCKKNLRDQISVNNIHTKDGFPNQPFNWENPINGVMMGTVPAGPLNPSLPWTSQSGSYIDASIIADYKSSDGWELVYNTFHPAYYNINASSGGLYFALYNKYRGLLRYYLYVPSGQFGGGANIQHGLSIYSGTGATTSMLNFEGSDIVDPSSNTPAFTKTTNVGVAQQGGWYAMQYEIAYAPNFVNASFPNLGIAWNSRTVSISDIQLNGQSTGTLTGNITQQGNDGMGSAILNGALAAAEIYGIASSGSSTSLTALQSAASGGLAGNLTGFFSGIFGGNSNNSQEVDLKMNSTITLTGTIVTPNALSPNTFVFPGESIAFGNASNPPLYTSTLGVFNLSGRPTINETTTSSRVTNADGTFYQYVNSYSVDAAIFNSLLVENPVVLSQASINILKTEVVILNPAQVNYPETLQVGGVQETIGNYTAYTGASVGTTYTVVRNQPANNLVAVRVAAKVIPTGASTGPVIVKTFLANLVHR